MATPARPSCPVCLRVCALALAAAAMLSCLAPAAQAAPGAEPRAVCTGDVFRLCGTEAPRVDHIVACLKKVRQNLSPACRAVVDAKG